MKNNDFFEKTKGQLIVSCQALAEEPLHSSYIMSRMAYAAMLGGAMGIRANSVEDISEIKKTVELPIIGIIKAEYKDSSVYITPTIKEVDELVECGVDVIATDATQRVRPNGLSLIDFFSEASKKHPKQLFMADCSTLEEAVLAEKIGFDIVSTTLCGYTDYTKGFALPNFPLINNLTKKIKIPIIVEGGIWTAVDFARIHKIPEIHAIVIGSAITRPMEITKHFLNSI